MSQICVDLPLNHSFWGVLNIFQKGFTAFLTLVSKSLMGDNPVMTGETNPCIQTIATEVPIYIYIYGHTRLVSPPLRYERTGLYPLQTAVESI